MGTRSIALLAALLPAFAGCESSGPPTPPEVPPPVEPDVSAETRASFVNRVWTVAESRQVAVGDVRVFLADGTLVMASPNATPAFGSWLYADGRLTIIEEGQKYPADILELTDTLFHIRMQGPNEPLEMRLTPAPLALPAATAAVEPETALLEPVPAPVADSLPGTAWRLARIAGVIVADASQATLAFPSDGRAGGDGSCNRFNAIVTIEGNAIAFGGIATTRKFCPARIMAQEDAYLAALNAARRFAVDGESLRILADDGTELLQFLAIDTVPTAAPNSIRRAAASGVSGLNGLWTIVGHHLPGVSALDDDQARVRYGETLRLTEHAAISAGNRCAEPRYATRQVPAASFLAEQFRLAPGSLAPLAARNQLRILEISCSGSPWTALGATLIEVDRDRALAPWDGVFFELARDRDFRAVGHEPAWQLEIRKGAEMRFTYDDGKGTTVTPAPRTQVDSRTGTRTLHAQTEASDLKVEIVPVACSDAASGRPFAATVTVTLNGRTFRGCGEDLASPYQG